MIGGMVLSTLVFAAGAVLDFALTTSPYQHGFDLKTVGVILMIVGAVGFVISLIAGIAASPRFHRSSTVIDDGRGNVVRREDRVV